MKDVILGQKIVMQCVALTEHPVGKIGGSDKVTASIDGDSGIGHGDTDHKGWNFRILRIATFSTMYRLILFIFYIKKNS